MYASSWFLTLFTTALPLPLASRVMDWFLSDGMEVIFRLAVAVLTVGKAEILSQDMEGMLKVRGGGVSGKSGERGGEICGVWGRAMRD